MPKKAAPVTADSLPTGQSEMIELPDGRKIPIRVPAGIPPQIAAAVVQQLRSDPQAALQAFEHAQRVLATPGLAQAYLGMGGGGGAALAAAAAGAGGAGAGPAVGPGAFLAEQVGGAGGADPTNGAASAPSPPGLQGLSPEKALEALSGDEELARVVEELKAGGPQALEKYWNDADVMSKISARLRAASLAEAGGGGGKAAGEGGAAAGVDADGLPVAVKKPSPGDGAGADAPPAPPATPGAGPASALHAAARRGDAAAIRALLSEAEGKAEGDAGAGAAAAARALLLDAPGDRSGATALGVAVGLGRLEAAKALLEAGAAVDKPDARGNTPLHYAAGYGRRECLELLLESGAKLGAANAAGQKAADVARQNGEAVIATLLAAREKRERKAGGKDKAGAGAGPSLEKKKAAGAAAAVGAAPAKKK